MLHTFIVDGGCLNNGRSSATMYYSFVVKDGDNLVHHQDVAPFSEEFAWAEMFDACTESCDRLQHKATNNVAEFVALLEP